MTVLHCSHCRKDVVIMGVSLGAASDGDIGQFRNAMERDGKLVLLNPPPFGKQRCPSCGAVLVDRDASV